MVRVAITSIGSGVGQAIADACRLSGLPLSLYGYGNNPLAFANFDCDFQRVLPGIYAADYTAALIEACEADAIDILLPGLDDELPLLATHRHRFEQLGVRLPIVHTKVIGWCRDKAAMCRELSTFADCFVQSYTLAEARFQAQQGRLTWPLIAKPRGGFASRDVLIIKDMAALEALTDSHILQSVAAPNQADPARVEFGLALAAGRVSQVSELSAQLVFGPQGNELGRFLTVNNLRGGVPVEVNPVNEPAVWQAIDTLLPQLTAFGLRGPLNFQGRLTDNGVRFFEMNARFTGITGLRARMGFNEVAAVITQELTLASANDWLRGNKRKVGLRQVTSRCVDKSRVEQVSSSPLPLRDGRGLPATGTTVLLTGASGLLGREVLSQWIEHPAVAKIMVLNHQQPVVDILAPAEREKVEGLDWHRLMNGSVNLGQVDLICHLASARPHATPGDYANSLALTQRLVRLACQFEIDIVFASSQAVYGRQRPTPWLETDPPAPETLYASHKLAAEMLCRTLGEIHHHCAATVIRFSQLYGGNDPARVKEPPHAMAVDALSQGRIIIQGGEQELDLLPVKDAAQALTLLLEQPRHAWPELVNCGSGTPIVVGELARQVADTVTWVTGKPVVLETVPGASCHPFGMDTSRARAWLGWQPQTDLQSTVANWIQAYLAAPDR